MGSVPVKTMRLGLFRLPSTWKHSGGGWQPNGPKLFGQFHHKRWSIFHSKSKSLNMNFTILHSFPYKVIPKWRFPNFPFASDLCPQGCRNGSCGSKTPHKQLSTAKNWHKSSACLWWLSSRILKIQISIVWWDQKIAFFFLVAFLNETTGAPWIISRISTTRQAKMGSPNGSSTLRGTGFSVLKNSALLKYGVNEYQQMWGVIYHRKSLTNINSIIESYHLIKKNRANMLCSIAEYLTHTISCRYVVITSTCN